MRILRIFAKVVGWFAVFYLAFATEVAIGFIVGHMIFGLPAEVYVCFCVGIITTLLFTIIATLMFAIHTEYGQFCSLPGKCKWKVGGRCAWNNQCSAQSNEPVIMIKL